MSKGTPDAVQKLAALKPSPNTSTRKRYSQEEIHAAIAAVQRGVSQDDVADALGVGPKANARGALAYAIGRWAMRWCKCHEKPARPRSVEEEL